MESASNERAPFKSYLNTVSEEDTEDQHSFGSGIAQEDDEINERRRLESMTKDQLVAELLKSRRESGMLGMATSEEGEMQPPPAVSETEMLPPPPAVSETKIQKELKLPNSNALEYANARKASTKARQERLEQLRSARSTQIEDDVEEDDDSGDESAKAKGNTWMAGVCL